MFKYKIIFFILLTLILASGNAYCQGGVLDKQIQGEIKDLQTRTIAGAVTYLDTEGGVIHLQTDRGEKVFYISVESNLYRAAHHIASIEISKGDPLIIQYATSSAGKNIILKLVDNKPEH